MVKLYKIVAAGFLASSCSVFAGDVEKGRIKANTCLGCHAVPSYTNVYPSYRVPRLAGQYAEYIVAALQAYRSGARKHATMQAQAGNLSDEDMADVAAYFASQEAAPPNPMLEVSDEVMKRIEVCAACHGNDGSSLAPAFPRIGGQHRDYLYHALRQYQSGGRSDPIMLGIVATLSDEDMRALARYYSRQDGLGKLTTRAFLERK